MYCYRNICKMVLIPVLQTKNQNLSNIQVYTANQRLSQVLNVVCFSITFPLRSFFSSLKHRMSIRRQLGIGNTCIRHWNRLTHFSQLCLHQFSSAFMKRNLQLFELTCLIFFGFYSPHIYWSHFILLSCTQWVWVGSGPYERQMTMAKCFVLFPPLTSFVTCRKSIFLSLIPSPISRNNVLKRKAS